MWPAKPGQEPGSLKAIFLVWCYPQAGGRGPLAAVRVGAGPGHPDCSVLDVTVLAWPDMSLPVAGPNRLEPPPYLPSALQDLPGCFKMKERPAGQSNMELDESTD